jgi:small-conductance mechanosensitive channel
VFNIDTEVLRANPYVFGAVAAIGTYVLLLFMKKLFQRQAEKLAYHHKQKVIYEILIYTVAYTGHIFMIVSALYLGFHFFPEHRTYPTWSFRIFFFALMWQVAIWGNYLIKKWMQISFHIKRKKDPAAASSVSIVELMVKVIFISVLVLFTLNNMGIEVTTMVAGLGIGGIAVALALQNVLGDLFSSLSIILDKPFVVGDFIILGEWLGEVEKIGLKTTRIRSLGGEQIIMSNSDLLSSRIRNMKRMHERRVALVFTLTHENTPEQLRKAVSIMSAIVRRTARVRFERCHFMKINLSSLDIELIYWVLSDDYDLHMDIQQEILMDVYRSYKEEGIDFAHPTQTLHIKPMQMSLIQENSPQRPATEKHSSFS